MITLLLLLLALLIIAIIVLVIGGLFAIAWPLAIVLIIGLIIDILVIKKLFKKKGSWCKASVFITERIEEIHRMDVKFTEPLMKGGCMNHKFRKALIKWGLSCMGIILTYELFGNIGILFGVGLIYVIISYLWKFLKKGFTWPLLSPSKELRGSPSVDRKNYTSYNERKV